MPTARWLINAADPERLGLLQALDADVTFAPPSLVRNDTFPAEIRLLIPGRDEGVIWKDLAAAGGTLAVGIGESDTYPTGGTFQLDYNGSTTGLTALAYNISASSLSTALNANAAVTAAGGVTVELIGTAGSGGALYAISFVTVGAKTLLVGTGTSLTPSSTVSVSRAVTGTASVKEVQTVRLLRAPYAFSSDWTLTSPSGSVTVTALAAGSMTTRAVFDVALPAEVNGGSFRLTTGKAQQTRFSFGVSNTAGRKQVFTVTPVADVSNSLRNTFFDIGDASGPVRVWLDVSSGSAAPPTPSGGRLIEVDIATNDTAATIASAIQAKLDAEAQFVSVLDTTTRARVTQISIGERPAPADGTAPSNTGFAFAVAISGSFDYYVGKYFVLPDQNGSVAVWFTDGTAVSTIPAAALNYTRALSVTIASADSAITMATTTAAAIDADAEFAASASGSAVTVTDAATGPRTVLAAIGTALGAIATLVTGLTVTVEVPFNSTAENLADMLSSYFEVTSVDATQWRLVAGSNGAWSTPTADSTALQFPKYFVGRISLATVEMARAFSDAGTETISPQLEIQYTDPNGYIATVYKAEVTVSKDVIDAASLSSVTGSAAGSSLYVMNGAAYGIAALAGGLDGISTTSKTTALIWVNDATDGFGLWELVSGTAATSWSAGVGRPIDYNASTNTKNWIRRI